MEKEKKKLKDKIGFRIAMVVFVACCVAVIFLTLYLFNGEIVSNVPDWFEDSYAVETEKIEGRKVFIIKKDKETDSDSIILYLHGGSYMAELKQEHWLFFEGLLQDTNATLVVPDYPLTPKYNYKDVFTMMEPCYEKILENKQDKTWIVMGDSAGGGLALALLEKMGEKGRKMPDALFLLSPWLDTSMENQKIDEVQSKDPMLSKPALKLAGEQYGRDIKEEDNYLVDPLYGPLQNLCPIVVFTGTADILNPDVAILEQRCKEAGTQITVKEYENAIHDFILYSFVKEDVDFGKEGYQDILEEMRQIREKKIEE